MMMDYLESIDRSIVLMINGWNSPFLDAVMWGVSAKSTWFPLYALLIYLFIRQSGTRKGIVFVLCAFVAVGLSDFVSVHFFKEVFLRYRPSHHADLTGQLHFHVYENGEVYKGGMYGFVSSHAANLFAICTFSFLALRKSLSWILYLLLAVAVLVSYSRIYLGVHYLSDVLVGALVGMLLAILVFRFIFMVIVGKEYHLK